MYKRKRILILSTSIIMLCLCLIAGATYALFSEEQTVTQHLQAGNLDIQLIRNSYSYKVLGDDGRFVTKGETGLTNDFTDPTNQNFFGITKDELIVPGSFAQATFTIKNAGTTAFAYNIAIDLKGNTAENAKALAEQLYVTIGYVNDDGSFGAPIVEGYLKDDQRQGNLAIVSGENGFAEFVAAGKNNTEKQMYIVVKFEELSNDVNNAAQNGNVEFDLVIVATQKAE